MAYPDYPVPVDEAQRLRELERYGVVDQPSDPHFERLVELANSIFAMPYVAISLVEANRQWFLASRGLSVRQTPRPMAFCAHAIASKGVLVVPDALNDERFSTNPMVSAEPHVRFYAGVPLTSPTGHNLGTLCVLDQKPHLPTATQIHQLELLGELVMRELELRRLAHLCPVTGLPDRVTLLAIGEREVVRARAEGKPLALLLFDVDNFRAINNRWGHQAGDQVLMDLCDVGGQFLREQDFAGRLDDGAFALLLVDQGPEGAMAVAEGLRQAASTMPGVFSHSEWRLHISGGLSVLATGDGCFYDLVRRSEQALQLAKGNGRNQIASLLADS
jgi:diguanylate cyclase (GGDEF)-like protein